MGSSIGRGNQYIQLVKVLYCKLPTNSNQPFKNATKLNLLASLVYRPIILIQLINSKLVQPWILTSFINFMLTCILVET